jgi:hypothetical protein
MCKQAAVRTNYALQQDLVELDGAGVVSKHGFALMVSLDTADMMGSKDYGVRAWPMSKAPYSPASLESC